MHDFIKFCGNSAIGFVKRCGFALWFSILNKSSVLEGVGRSVGFYEFLAQFFPSQRMVFVSVGVVVLPTFPKPYYNYKLIKFNSF